MRRRAIGVGVWLLAAAAAGGQDQRPIEFNRDVRPILADHCYQCHGPDAKNRQAELRLDQAEAALAAREGGPAIIPGKPAESELVRRITARDPAERMPPAELARPLNDEQIATLRRWIEQGAAWDKHWSLVRPARPAIASIDALVLSRLNQEGLQASPPADRATLLRRVTLDLTGLPPAPAEIAAFHADQRPDAYERAVDRLLASPRYGERMAVPWLNAARYADTSGYQSDGERIMWRWRDWVIEALNANMPYDQFTTLQLAGDLLPGATLEQKLATGFNRNHRGNGEGGIISEEYAVEYVIDRIETTSTVWLGLTLGCGRCHDHKFDPFTQRDFYQLYSLFNDVSEKGRAIKLGNSPPYLKTPTRLQQEQLAKLEEQVTQAFVAWNNRDDELSESLAAWERTFSPQPATFDWQPTADLMVAVSLDADDMSGKFVDGKTSLADGPIGQAATFDGKCCLEAGDLASFGFLDKFTLSAWVLVPAGGGGGTVVSRMTDAAEGDGYQLVIAGGKVQLNLVKRWLDDAIRVETAEPIEPGKWHHVAASYDGSREADGIRLYVDGQPQQAEVLLDELNQTFTTKEPLRIGGGGGPAMRFRGQIDEVRIHGYELTPLDMLVIATATPVSEILATPPERRTSGERAKLRTYFLAEHAPADIRLAHRQLHAAARKSRAFWESLPTTMVMDDLAPRPAHILIRGQYDQPGEPVEPKVLEQILPLPPGSPNNRLGLARWLVDPDHPLTARVTVNRYWQLYFGTGLVKTAEDFGSQGEWPVHPELLDLLATDFVASGWDVKRLARQIVTSGTYRQSSRLTPELAERDPDNRLLARGPRVRLPAEMVRDQALAASGLLVEQIGGPSVRPYQPPGLWKELTGGDDYEPGRGADLYRRSLYTFWKRTIPPPSMATFDAATRESCTVRVAPTNTPLQALALLNEETYVEAARVLAERVLREAARPDERLALAFMLLLSREPAAEELAILRTALDRQLTGYTAEPADAEKLLAVGQFPRSTDVPAGELAAYAAVCSTILNLDEVVTKE
jgi:mono/diheme cytochrome c family protein